MNKRTIIKLHLSISNNRYNLRIDDMDSTIKKMVDTFIIDSGRNEVTLEGVIQERIEFKTKSQLGYYFGVVLPFINDGLIDMGYKELNIKLTDDFLRSKFLTVVVANEYTGEVLESTRSISSLFKEDMSKFIDLCVKFAAEDLKVIIPIAE